MTFGANNVTLDLNAGSDFQGNVGGLGAAYTGDIINFAPGQYTFSAPIAGGLFAQGSGDILECTTCTSTAGVFLYVSGSSAVNLSGPAPGLAAVQNNINFRHPRLVLTPTSSSTSSIAP